LAESKEMTVTRKGLSLAAAALITAGLGATACASTTVATLVTCSPHHHPKAACRQQRVQRSGSLPVIVWVARNPVSKSDPYRDIEPENDPAHVAPEDPAVHAPVEVPVGGDR
jgi:hypothetical protein